MFKNNLKAAISITVLNKRSCAMVSFVQKVGEAGQIKKYTQGFASRTDTSQYTVLLMLRLISLIDNHNGNNLVQNTFYLSLISKN